MKIHYAKLDWRLIDGIEVPISQQFGDAYFSKDNGLLETRHVFLNGNDLPQRLSQLPPNAYFCVAETGFGTGLNFLALWQLWRQIRPHPSCHLHFISVEKFPLRQPDLQRALQAWPELAEYAAQLMAQYPIALAGCHRLVFPEDAISCDLWLGDALDIMPHWVKSQPIDAWFLDGFSPSCNPEIWQKHILDHVIRLSSAGTTFASFSVAGVVKRGLQAHGVHISRPRGYKHKQQMLKGILPVNTEAIDNTEAIKSTKNAQHTKTTTQTFPQRAAQQIAVIGAGIAGLNAAWALAQRGHHVLLLDATAALSGASGNPMALLNPKLSPAAQTSDHLMTMAWLYALRFYVGFAGYRSLAVNTFILKANEHTAQLAQDYSAEILEAQTAAELGALGLSTAFASMQLKHAGCVQPHVFAAQILKHPQIRYQQARVQRLAQQDHKVQLYGLNDSTTQNQELLATVDRVVVCSAGQTQHLLDGYAVLRPIRGQVSWCDVPDTLHAHGIALEQAYSYGGYLLAQDASQLLLGASFHPDREDAAVLPKDHAHNFALLQQVFPQLAAQLPNIGQWQGRASVRAQTRDYLPIVGAHGESDRVYSMAGMGSKGFLFAPLCSELLCAIMFQEAYPVSANLLRQLSPSRFNKTQKPKKPYFQNPNTVSERQQ